MIDILRSLREPVLSRVTKNNCYALKLKRRWQTCIAVVALTLIFGQILAQTMQHKAALKAAQSRLVTASSDYTARLWDGFLACQIPWCIQVFPDLNARNSIVFFYVLGKLAGFIDRDRLPLGPTHLKT